MSRKRSLSDLFYGRNPGAEHVVQSIKKKPELGDCFESRWVQGLRQYEIAPAVWVGPAYATHVWRLMDPLQDTE